MVCFQYRFDFIANFNRIKNPKPAISPSQIDHSNKKIIKSKFKMARWGKKHKRALCALFAKKLANPEKEF